MNVKFAKSLNNEITTVTHIVVRFTIILKVFTVFNQHFKFTWRSTLSPYPQKVTDVDYAKQ